MDLETEKSLKESEYSPSMRIKSESKQATPNLNTRIQARFSIKDKIHPYIE